MNSLRPCRSCGEDIHLVVNVATGKWMPVDDQASPEGNIVLDVYRRTADVLAGQRLRAARSINEPLHLAHHYTCPKADQHRKPPQDETLFDPEVAP